MATTNRNSNLAEPKYEWTVMLYMAGDNNLSEECVYSLTEIKEALEPAFDKLAMVAQFDPSGVRAETKRYELRSIKESSLDDDAKKTGWKASETDTGEPQNLLDFIRWGISQYKAKHYMVILVGHGDGTDQDFLMRDENPPNSLSLPELRDVFTKLTLDGHEIEILGMDTCLMNMTEVCYELYRASKRADGSISLTYLVGSEGFAPNTGWPYAEIVRELTAKIKTGGATASWLAEFIVDKYQEFYKPYINGGISVDQSLLKISNIEGLKEAVFRLVDSFLDEANSGELDYMKPKQNALVLAHWEAQSYNGEVFVDLSDFCDRVIQRYKEVSPNAQVIKRCENVIKAIEGVTLKSAVAGAAFQFSFGLSIYFPWAVLSSRYANLTFPQESQWLDFLKRYHELTRRPGRQHRGEPRLDLELPPGRASVPTNKGRNGKMESMRNPPINEFVSKPGDFVPSNGTRPQPAPESKKKSRKRPTKRPRNTNKK